MAASMRPLAVPLYDWCGRHGQELPPFPSADYLNTPYLPAAPCLPDDAKSQLKMAATTWRTGIGVLLRQETTRNPKVHEANKVCIAQLAALGIPPAEWLLSRVETYRMSQLASELPYPPFGFVYSANALSTVLEHDFLMDKWLGSLASARRYTSDINKEAQTLWYAIRHAAVRRQDTAQLLEQYRAKVLECRAHNKAAVASLAASAAAGEYIW